MLDIDAELSKMIAKLPNVPPSIVPKDMCDKPFMAPQAPTHYVLKTTGGPADVCVHMARRIRYYFCSSSSLNSDQNLIRTLADMVAVTRYM